MDEEKNKPDAGEHQITEFLFELSDGNKVALDQIIPLVEMELRRIAHNYMNREGSNHTLQTTALINEVYIKLVDQRDVRWQNRSHFFGISAQIMRRILIDYARDRMAEKRGGKFLHVPLEEAEHVSWEKPEELLALDDALKRLAEMDAMKSRIVELRYFAGLTLEETASVLGIAPVTVSVNWRLAKAWLAREILGL